MDTLSPMSKSVPIGTSIVKKPPQKKSDESKRENGLEKNIKDSDEISSIEIENKYISATISNKNGGEITSWKLRNYNSYHGGVVDLIQENGLNFELTNSDGKEIHLKDYNLFLEFPPYKKIILNETNSSYEFVFYLPIEDGRVIKKMIFYHDQYSVDIIITLENLQDYIINRRYFFGWQNGLPSTEKDIEEDVRYSKAYAYLNGELESVDVSDEESKDESYNGQVDWIAIRTKYFLASIVPFSIKKIGGAIIEAEGKKINDVINKVYSISLEVPYFPVSTFTDSFTVYLGPLDHGILKSYDVDLQTLVMNNDWYESLFRPMALLILPVLKGLHHVIPNYGFVIIIFSILIKLILHPLTKKSHQSMSEMQYWQPKIAELREKYKEDPQRMNKEMMKFYKEHGINPLGGCLPTLLQMPLLIGLFIVFRSTIQLRGQPFILWINDLSRPDELFLGFSLPLIGNTIHVLPILMAISMVWQSKFTITDPKQKMMAYIMPAFLLFIFYSFPSGLNLYYTLFNALTMVQTLLIKKKMHPDKSSSNEEKMKIGKKGSASKPPSKRNK
jgi:YidC/Oxa1 family membrane protein insertase